MEIFGYPEHLQELPKPTPTPTAPKTRLQSLVAPKTSPPRAEIYTVAPTSKTSPILAVAGRCSFPRSVKFLPRCPYPPIPSGPPRRSLPRPWLRVRDDNNTTCSTPTTIASTATSPYAASPWTLLPGLAPLGGVAADDDATNRHRTGLLGSLVKEGGGHIYSLATAGDLLYTGTDSRNVRMRDRCELDRFSSGSGRIYTGHQDGKVHVWRRAEDAASAIVAVAVQHRRLGSLSRFRDVKGEPRASHHARPREEKNWPMISF